MTKPSPLSTPVLIGALLFLLAAGLMAHRIINSDERRIRRQLGKLVDLAEKSAPEKPLALLSRTKDILKVFSEEPEIDFGGTLPNVSGRSELAGVLQYTRATVQRLDLKILDEELSISADGTRAEMLLTAEATVTMGGDTGREVREFHLNWTKEGNSWHIDQAYPAPSIQSPATP